MHTWTRLAAIISLCIVTVALAQTDDPAAELRQQYFGKMVTLSTPADGDLLIFGPDGSLTRGKPGADSTFGHLVVRELSINADRITIAGDRVFLIYDPVEKRFRDYLELMADDKWRQSLGIPAISKGDREWFEKRRPLRIEIALAGADRKSALEKVVAPTGDLQYPKPAPETAKPEVANAPGPSRVVGGVSAPRATHTPDPRYSEFAQKARLQGMCRLWVVIGPDGLVKDIKVQRPLGLGLDENAIDAVKAWRFKPSEKDGKPVAVQVNVEINFRLY